MRDQKGIDNSLFIDKDGKPYLFWVNFTEDVENNCVVAELRSNGLNVNQIAVKYGGGGHLNASGASIKDFSVADEMLEDLNKLVRGEY